MQIRTRVSNNLLIAPAGGATQDGNQEANYVLAINQSRAALLEPASTINGVNYYYTATSNVDASGDAKTDVYVAYNEDTALTDTVANKTAYDDDFNTNYGITSPSAGYDNVAYGYVDYSFYLKATNSDAETRQVYMSKCNLMYNGDTLTTTPLPDKAWRAAMFVQDASKETAQTTALASTNVITILTPSGAENFSTTDYAVGDSSGTPTVIDLSYGATGSPKTAYNQGAVVDGNLASAATKYYKVTIRLWLEGEDKTCNNDTYASLTKDWTLDLAFTLGQNDADEGDKTVAVTNIGSVVSGTLTKDGTKLTAGLKNGTGETLVGETIASTAWYKINAATGMASGVEAADGTASGTNNVVFTASKSGTYFAIITTQKGTTYRTPAESVTVGP